MELKGKQISLYLKIVGVVYVVVMYTIYAIIKKTFLTLPEISGLLAIGAFITNIIPSPVDISLIKTAVKKQDKKE